MPKSWSRGKLRSQGDEPENRQDKLQQASALLTWTGKL
jgi:hypothetical protein